MNERVKKIAEGIRRQVSITLSIKVKDPVVESVTIKSVALSPDLRSARVFYVLGEDCSDDPKKVYRHLRKASGFVRRELANSMPFKYVPRIIFVKDHSFEERSAVEELYEKIRKKESGNEK